MILSFVGFLSNGVNSATLRSRAAYPGLVTDGLAVAGEGAIALPAKLLTPPVSLMIASLPQERQYRYSRTLANLLVFFYKRLDLPPGESGNRMRLGVRYSRLKENPVGTRPQERKVVTRQRGFDFHGSAASVTAIWSRRSSSRGRVGRWRAGSLLMVPSLKVAMGTSVELSESSPQRTVRSVDQYERCLRLKSRTGAQGNRVSCLLLGRAGRNGKVVRRATTEHREHRVGLGLIHRQAVLPLDLDPHSEVPAPVMLRQPLGRVLVAFPGIDRRRRGREVVEITSKPDLDGIRPRSHAAVVRLGEGDDMIDLRIVRVIKAAQCIRREMTALIVYDVLLDG